MLADRLEVLRQPHEGQAQRESNQTYPNPRLNVLSGTEYSTPGIEVLTTVKFSFQSLNMCLSAGYPVSNWVSIQGDHDWQRLT
jgi:hypothetical protein